MMEILTHYICQSFAVLLCKIIPLIPILLGKKYHLFRFCLYKGLHAFLISANLCRGGRRGVWFRVHGDVQRRHNRDRDADSLWDKGSRYYYVDMA